MFAIAWQYLTGRAVATDPTDRQKAEWPPHPDRVFQALVAAWGEAGADVGGKAALEWLEQQGEPEVSVPDSRAVAHTGGEKIYVPVNDLEGPSRGDYQPKHLALLPALRSRKERYFPAIQTGDATCALRWPQASAPADHLATLKSLCAQATHIGHSRSLVRMWVEDAPPAPTWVPAPERLRRSLSLRVPVQGRLAALIKAYAGGGPGWERPPWAPWRGYVPARAEGKMAQGVFDDRMIVLRHAGGDRIHLLQTAAFTDALRKALIAACDKPPAVSAEVKALVSGHDHPTGRAIEKPHVAFLALAHVGSPHADGHIMGFVLALPRGIAPEAEHEIYKVLGRCLGDDGSGTLRLTAGSAGACELSVDNRPAPPRALQEKTWTAASMSWATVTPIVLDKLPPRRHVNDDAWAAGQIAEACARQGLPKPEQIAILPVSRFVGAPAAREFRPLRRKSDNAKRWHVHAQIDFPEPVRGPLVLGAGRYRGLGLCRPLTVGDV